MLGSLLGPLNGTMIVLALRSIADEFGISVGGATWLITAYLVGTASLNTLGGKIGDRYGRRPVMFGALIAFALLSLGAALAPSFPVLLSFRVGQAVAITLVAPNGMALLREVVPVERRASRFGLMAGGMALSAAAGPLVGGVLLAVADWRALFYVNLPVIVAALALGWRAWPAAPPTIRPRPQLGGARPPLPVPRRAW